MRSLLVAAVAALGILTSVGAEAAGEPRVPRLGRIVVVVFENKDVRRGDRRAVCTDIRSSWLAVTRCSTNYYAVERPSLPNYLAMISGSTQGLTKNCTECVFEARNLADTIEVSGRTWKTYAEGLPARRVHRRPSPARYVKRHNPFLYFTSVLSNPTQATAHRSVFGVRRRQ